MRVLCVGNMYPPHHLGGYELVWQGAVQALRAAGHGGRVLGGLATAEQNAAPRFEARVVAVLEEVAGE